VFQKCVILVCRSSSKPNLSNMKHFYALVFAVLLTCQLHSQLVVDNTQPAEQVIEDVFLANGIFVANVAHYGDPTFIGTFDGTNAGLGISNGIIMGSGDVTGAIGPNNQGNHSSSSTEYYNSIDADLMSILDNYSANDWSVVEFDFIATGDSLDFQFVFGSEEYLEFVYSAFNDGFGFFVSGPGISGPYTNGAMNIALVPGTTLPVSINNVNSTLNEAYYVDNGDGYTEPYASDGFYVQADGLTALMHASIGDLVVGEVYHIKLAVADASDTILDSWVFLAGDSFVQFCVEEQNFVEDVCMLSTLEADVEYTGTCGTIELQNYSDINIEYTNCYFEMGDGNVSDACTGMVSHTYDEPGTYQLKLVYEVGEFQAKFKVGEVIISSTLPVQPAVSYVNNILSANNWNQTDEIQWYFNGTDIEGAENTTYEATESGEYTLSYTNSCGTLVSEGFNVVSIVENFGTDVLIYPNPTDGLFTIKTPAGISCNISIYNSLGQIVYKSNSTSQILFDEILNAGTYMIEVKSANNAAHIFRQTLIVR